MPNELEGLVTREDRRTALLLLLLFAIVSAIFLIPMALVKGILIGVSIVPAFFVGQCFRVHEQRAEPFVGWLAVFLLFYGVVLFVVPSSHFVGSLLLLVVPEWMLIKSWRKWRWGFAH